MTPLSFTAFFTALSEQLDCALVIGGDLNFGLNKEMDRLSTAGTQRNWESTNIVKQYMSDYGLAMHGVLSTPTVGNLLSSHMSITLTLVWIIS